MNQFLQMDPGLFEMTQHGLLRGIDLRQGRKLLYHSGELFQDRSPAAIEGLMSMSGQPRLGFRHA